MNFFSLLGPVEVVERVLRVGSATVRPLAAMLALSPGGYTLRLQRAAVDFGSEHSFEQAAQRLRWHHGMALSATTVRIIIITLRHARAIALCQRAGSATGALPEEGPEHIVAEIDGTMIPIVQSEGSQRRSCHYREFRLSAARVHQSVHTEYGVSVEVEQAGRDWAAAIARAGWGVDSHVHVVADGAPWILQHCQRHLGSRATFLVDFYHACEYLAAPAPSAGTHPRWLHVQKKRLLQGHPERVLKALEVFREPDHHEDEQAPVRLAYRYLCNRMDQLDYPAAIADDLPFGSGMIEGGHRHVLHKRLKISGAWRTLENAEAMAHLRVCRANDRENLYWSELPNAA